MSQTTEVAIMDRLMDKMEALHNWMRNSGLPCDTHQRLRFHLEHLQLDLIELNKLVRASSVAIEEAKRSQLQENKKAKPAFVK